MIRRIASHLAVIAVTFVLVLFGLLLLAYNSQRYVAYASAAAGDHLQVAPANSLAWAKTTGPAWGFANAAPGDSTTGAVRLRSLGTSPGAGLSVGASVPAGGVPAIASQLEVTAMHLGSADLLPHWDGHCGGPVTVAVLMECDDRPALPMPVGGDGELFSMTIRFDPASGNAYQGASASVTFEFTLAAAATDVPSSVTPTFVPPTLSPTPAGTPSPADTPPPTATPTATGGADTGTTSPAPPTGTPTFQSTPSETAVGATSTATPIPPASGSGVDGRHVLGAGMLGMALLVIAGWLAAIVLIRRQRDER